MNLVLCDMYLRKFLILHQYFGGSQYRKWVGTYIGTDIYCGYLQMGDQSVEVTEEKMDEAQLLKGKAVEAMSEGKHVGYKSLNNAFM